MALGLLLCSLLLCYLLVQLVRFLRADADLTLLWAELFGSKPTNTFEGKVVWITGASSGIGEELSYQLAKLKALLVLSARREDELHRVKQKCLEYSRLQNDSVLVLPLDLYEWNSHAAATEIVIQHFGKIDILVNNGGRSQRSLFVDTNLDVYRALMELNYLGTVSMTKYVLPRMIERKKGQIVNVSSLVGIVGAPLSSGYCASKHAVQGVFNSLRTELTEYPEINILNVCPGPVQSQIVKNAFSEEITKVSLASMDQSYKMPTERCVHLMLVGMANDLKEVWIAEHPFLLICYIWQYCPTWAWWLTNKLAKRRIQNFKSGVDADSLYFTKLETKTS
ncbi:dehydrogenase/reductase SDR family member 7 [Latimeria chalumnae]|uniref:Dehydrogenase/reductase 7 n=1 Tax=Latimeria chalumnae TaxID=7897 RepID=H3BH32_LATCH|nr:PREDICTED: dehydrogenase/reductase SDR family member 7 [Latimeria chalumnae]|eukprot:XP_005986487.1 PREDICTED: dehydrogenase/reductase SDR family member 7 [Latimeria chalumnae]